MSVHLSYFVIVTLGMLLIAISSYHMGRQDERRAAEMRERLMRVIGGPR